MAGDYYYVKAGGTKTTGVTTKQTGSFAALGAANYYGTIATAIVGGAGGDDIVCISDASVFTNTVSGPGSGSAISIITVDDSNCENSVTASSAMFTGNDCTFNGICYVYGTRAVIDDDHGSTAANSHIIYDSCHIEVTGSADVLVYALADNIRHEYINCVFTGIASSYFLSIRSGSSVEMVGCTLSGLTGQFSDGGWSTPNGIFKAEGCDFSSVTDTLFKSVGGSQVDGFNISISNCKLNSSVAFFNETLVGGNQQLLVTNSAATIAASEYQYHFETAMGTVVDQDEVGIYRDEATAFPSGEKVSLKCVTSAIAAIGGPLGFSFPARYAELSNTASDNITLYLASTAVLNDIDVWVELTYPDGSVAGQTNFLSTRNAERMDAAGVALTTDSGSSWKDAGADLTGHNEYQIDIDTSADAGSDCVPDIRVFVGAPSTTIYFCTTIGLS